MRFRPVCRCFRLALLPTIATGILTLSLAGCGRSDPAGSAAADRSSLLTPAILEAGGLQQTLLSQSPPPAPYATELAVYHRFRHALRNSATRESAEQELFERWHAHPTNFLWIETAVLNYESLSRKQDYVQLRKLAAGSDSTTAVARFLYGRRFQGRRADALASYLQAEERQHELDPLQRLWLQSRLAESENSAGDREHATARIRSSLSEAWQQGGPHLTALWWCQLASFSRLGGRLDDALYAAALARTCAERTGLPELSIRADFELGHAHEARLEFSSAEHVFEQCRQIAHAADLGPLERDAVMFLSLVHSMRGDLVAELSSLRLAVELSHRNRSPGDITRSSAALANCLRRAGQLDSTRVRLEEATRLHREAFGQDARHHLLDAVWQLYLLQIGDYAAVDSLQAVMDRSESGRPVLPRLEPVLALIEQGLKTGRPDIAYRGLARATEIRNGPRSGTLTYEDRLSLAMVSARFLARQGEFRLAERELDTVAGLLEGADLPEWQWEYQRARGEIARLAGDTQAAETAFARCGELAAEIGDPNWVRQSRVLLGQVLIDRGRSEQAAALFRTVRRAPEYWPRLAAALYLGIAAARQQDHRAALDHFADADALLKSDAPDDLVARLRLEQGKSLSALGQPDAALARLRDAARPRFASEAKFDNEALLAFDSDVQRERSELIVGLLHDVPDLAGPLGPAVEALALASEVRWQVDADPIIPAARALEHLALTGGSPVVVYFAGQERCFAWLGTVDGWTMWELPPARELRDLVRAVIADMEQPERPVAWSQAAALTEILLGPALPRWRTGEVLHLAPDGILTALPWAALPLPAANGAAQRLVVDHGPLVLIASLAPNPRSAADNLKVTAGRLLAIGADGRVDRQADDRAASTTVLRHAEAEARDIAAMWPTDRVEIYLGEDAHWSHVRASGLARFSAIHIATHAAISQGLPGASTMRLATQGDGVPLTLPEVRELPLAAELVYLSCCEAAHLGWDTGSALNSFARAFLQAGAAAVVAPSIRVEDAAARQFSLRFYHHWLGGANHAESLRRAQVDLKQATGRFAHPAAWAFYGCYLPGPS